MLYILYGKDKDKTKKKARALIDALIKKKPNAETFLLTAENFTEALFEEYINSQGLFENKYIVLLDNIFQTDYAKIVFIKKVKEVGETDNIFLLLEGSIDAKTLSKLKNHAQKVEEVKGKVEKNSKSNIFFIADSLGSRDKRKLWLDYRKCIDKGFSREEILGILFWQIKTLILVYKKDTAGINSFVLNKAKVYSKNYTFYELQNISSELVDIYHNAHNGKADFETTLEKFILDI